jgi:glycosyltransferase involved in cell wall biosynthesis
VNARRLLIVCYLHPPMPFLGGDPWSGLTTQLRRLGHRVTIVTTAAYGALETDVELDVVRTPDLTSSRRLRRVLRRAPVARPGQLAAVAKPPPALLTKVIVPDAHLAGWVARAVPTIRRLVRTRAIECMITTSPPDSSHLAGLALGRDRPAWIADLRDGWTFEGLREPFPTAVQRALDARLEAAVARRADRVTAATRPIMEDLRARYGAGGACVPNAWDPDLEPEVAQARPPELSGDRVNLVFTGTLAGVRGHDDRALFEALRRVSREQPRTASRLRLVIAGRLTHEELSVLRAPELSPLVELVGALPRPAAIALQRRGDALLLVTSNHTSIVTGKLFEYLTAGRPILALAGDNEAARIIRETGTGEIVPPDDVDAIVAGLRRVADRSLAFAPRGVERYTYAASAAALVEEIEQAIARRRYAHAKPRSARQTTAR